MSDSPRHAKHGDYGEDVSGRDANQQSINSDEGNPANWFPKSERDANQLPKPPDHLSDAWESCWYVSSHDPEKAWAIDDPALLRIEPIYMRHVTPPPPGERGEAEELAVTRDERGRWQRVWWWEVCNESHPDAQPFMEVRYA